MVAVLISNAFDNVKIDSRRVISGRKEVQSSGIGLKMLKLSRVIGVTRADYKLQVRAHVTNPRCEP